MFKCVSSKNIMILRKLIRWLKNKFFPYSDREIDPDEIFLDSSNLPQFDTHQFEGRIEKPISKRIIIFLGITFLFIMLVFTGKLWMLQVNEGEVYAALSENNRLLHSLLFADRGVIFDRNKTELAWNVPNEEGAFSKRKYSTLSGLAHVLGYIQYPLKDSSNVYYQETFVGKTGVEGFFNEELGGKNGLKIIETNALGEKQSESLLRPTQHGKNIVLSIDAKVQQALFNFIKSTSQTVGFKGGSGVLIDIETGEILALTSFPEYSPQSITDGDAKALQQYQQNNQKPFLNRAVSGLYTPGSIVKPFLAAAALEEKVISPDTKILSTGSIAIPNPYDESKETVFNDWKAHGWVDMRQALAVSSNVYFYEIGGGFSSQDGSASGVEDQKGLGIATIYKYMKIFGFGENTGIQLSPEEEGTVPNPKWKKENFADGVWRIGDTYNTSIGQYGFQVTPIQAVRAIAAVGNEGKLLTPTFVLDDTADADVIPIDKKHFKVIKEGMRLAVTEGTAKGLNIRGVSVAAKTGTAELGSKKQFVNSWVIGFFPYEKPRYAFAVIMERGPSDNLIGALYVMRQLLEWMEINTPLYLEPI